ncbi:hypothetical protein GIB67_002744 [Kingdonia uniflora]|uniref:U-box domain-containing protein n=1 Tax=Kingdonia uniflora TaxID=39325 RepID=A0A7J7N421_9MAGN|nr:hypothetical protein GIB67_002744 [Kingdonia uniflora]
MLRLVKFGNFGISEQKQAAKEMHKLTLALLSPLKEKLAHFAHFAHFAKEKFPIPVLLSPLKVWDKDETDPQLQENIIPTVFNISNHDENFKAFVNNPDAITSVIKALDTGNAKTKVTAARILFKLSTYNLNRVIIGDSGGVKALLNIIEDGSDRTAMMYAIKAIFNICMIRNNRLQAIEDGQ